MTTRDAASLVLDATALASSFNFGSKVGDFSAVGDVGGQQILFWSFEGIHAIMIGAKKYGGDGGDLAATAQIPADGKLYIAELQARNGTLCYIKMKIGDTDVAVGNNGADDAVVLTAPNLAVRFAGISCGARVNRLHFEIVK
jgi:hypothetical protein